MGMWGGERAIEGHANPTKTDRKAKSEKSPRQFARRHLVYVSRRGRFWLLGPGRSRHPRPSANFCPGPTAPGPRAEKVANPLNVFRTKFAARRSNTSEDQPPQPHIGAPACAAMPVPRVDIY